MLPLVTRTLYTTNIPKAAVVKDGSGRVVVFVVRVIVVVVEAVVVMVVVVVVVVVECVVAAATTIVVVVVVVVVVMVVVAVVIVVVVVAAIVVAVIAAVAVALRCGQRTTLSCLWAVDSALRWYRGELCPVVLSQLPCRSYDIRPIQSTTLKHDTVGSNKGCFSVRFSDSACYIN